MTKASQKAAQKGTQNSITLRLSDEELKMLDKKCAVKGLDRSAFLRVLIREWDIKGVCITSVCQPDIQNESKATESRITSDIQKNSVIEDLKVRTGMVTADELWSPPVAQKPVLIEGLDGRVKGILESSVSGMRKMYLLQEADGERFNRYVAEYCFDRDLEVENLVMSESVAREILGRYMPKAEPEVVVKAVVTEDDAFKQVFFNEGNEVQEFKGSAWKEPKKAKKGWKK